METKTKTKKIIQRQMRLDQMYFLTSTSYVPLADSFGTTCMNCGKLIANIANVKGKKDDKNYLIGFDCLDTFLLNNNLLDGNSKANFEFAKKALPKVVSIYKEVKQFVIDNPQITDIKIERIFDTWVTVDYFVHTKQIWNSSIKIKAMDFKLLEATIQGVSKDIKLTVKAN